MFTIPDIHSALEPLVCWSGAFTDEEIEKIIKLGDSEEFQQARVGADTGEGSKNLDARKSTVSWIKPDQDNSWLFNKTAEIVARINTDKFQFDLSHFDAFQYTTYRSGEFYKWHIDGSVADTFGARHRKLGFSLMLSDPETDFTGGEFQIIPGGNPDDVNSTKMKKGDLIAFPSFIPHQVTEVLSGKRKSLVWWVLGSKFK
jgi:predicted 2-oxoglutarate/Fe(II)-dependent dioxygenase YbiX